MMLSDEFLENVADFYGCLSVDEFAERLGLSTQELMEELETLIDENLFSLMEDMGYEEREADGKEEGED